MSDINKEITTEGTENTELLKTFSKFSVLSVAKILAAAYEMHDFDLI